MCIGLTFNSLPLRGFYPLTINDRCLIFFGGGGMSKFLKESRIQPLSYALLFELQLHLI